MKSARIHSLPRVARNQRYIKRCVEFAFRCEYRCSFTEPEPEPVERQHFAGAGAIAEVFCSGSVSGYVNSYKMLQKTLNFSY
jgi:hypothetical protein